MAETKADIATAKENEAKAAEAGVIDDVQLLERRLKRRRRCLRLAIGISATGVLIIAGAIVAAVLLTQQNKPSPPPYLAKRSLIRANTVEQLPKASDQASRRKRQAGFAADTTDSTSSPTDSEVTSYYSSATTSPTQLDSNDNSSVEVPSVSTTTIVLSSNSSSVVMLIVHGEVLPLNDSSTDRRRRDADGSGQTNFADSVKNTPIQSMSLVLVEGNPIDGSINSIKASTSSNDSFVNTAAIVAQQLLVNQTAAAIDSDSNNSNSTSNEANRRKRSVDDADTDTRQKCQYVENRDNVIDYCVKMSTKTDEAADQIVYKKDFTSINTRDRVRRDADGASASQSELDVSVSMESHLSASSGLIQKGVMTGSANLDVLHIDSSDAEPMKLEKRAETNFDVALDGVDDETVVGISQYISTVQFVEVNQTERALSSYNLTTLNSTDYHATGNELDNVTHSISKRDVSSSQSVRMGEIFGQPIEVGFQLYSSRYLMFVAGTFTAGPLTIPIFSEVLEPSSGLAQTVNMIAGLKWTVEQILSATVRATAGIVNDLNTSLLGVVTTTLQQIRAEADGAKADFLGVATDVANQLNQYTQKLNQKVKQVTADFEKMVADGRANIQKVRDDAQSLISVYNTSLAPQVKELEDTISLVSSTIAQLRNDVQGIIDFLVGKNSILSQITCLVEAEQAVALQFYDSMETNVTDLYNTEVGRLLTFEDTLVSTRDWLIATLVKETALDIDTFEEAVGRQLSKYKLLKNSTEAELDSIRAQILSLFQSQTNRLEVLRLNLVKNYLLNVTTNLDSAINDSTAIVADYAARKEADAEAAVELIRTIATQKLASYSGYKTTFLSELNAIKASFLSNVSQKLKNSSSVNGNSSVDVLTRISNQVAAAISAVQSSLPLSADDWRSVSDTIAELQQNVTNDLASARDWSADYAQQLLNDTLATGSRVNDRVNQLRRDLAGATASEVALLEDFASNATLYAQSVIARGRAVLDDARRAVTQALTVRLDDAISTIGDSLDELTGDWGDIVNSSAVRVGNAIVNASGTVEAAAEALVSDVVGDADRFASSLPTSFQDLETRFVQTFTDSLDNIQNNVTLFLNTTESVKQQVVYYVTVFTNITWWSNVLENKFGNLTALRNAFAAFVQEKQQQADTLVNDTQRTIDTAVSQLAAIASNTYDWTRDFASSDLLSVSSILETPFINGVNKVEARWNNIANLASSMRGKLNTAIDQLRDGLGSNCSAVLDAFNNVGRYESLNPTVDIFDWAFLGNSYDAVSSSLRAFESIVGNIKSQVQSDVTAVVNDVKTVVSPDAWKQAFQSALANVTLLQTIYKFSARSVSTSSDSVGASAGSVQADGTAAVQSASTSDLAQKSSLSTTTQLAQPLSDANSMRSGLINSMLSAHASSERQIKSYPLFYNRYPLGVIPTPFGPILISCVTQVTGRLYAGAMYTGDQIAATMRPNVEARVAADAAWVPVVLVVGAQAYASTQVSVPVRIGWQMGSTKVTGSASVGYGISVGADLYYQVITICFQSVCWRIRIGSRRVTVCVPVPTICYTSPHYLFDYSYTRSNTQTLLTF